MTLYRSYQSDEEHQRQCTTEGDPEPEPTESVIDQASEIAFIGDLERAIEARNRAERNWLAAAVTARKEALEVEGRLRLQLKIVKEADEPDGFGTMPKWGKVE